ncbi:hypothetical protein D1007_15498 [Hordeum vulgare]|nr:hypothetical protein D1007_15498 [Hordeum vulgare]
MNPAIGTTFTPHPPLESNVLGTSELVSVEPSREVTSSAAEGSVTHVSPKHTSDMNSIEIQVLHELLNQIQAMGMTDSQATIYAQIGLRPDDREIRVPPITHLISIVE